MSTFIRKDSTALATGDTLCANCNAPLKLHLDVGTMFPVCPSVGRGAARVFESGATRNVDDKKLDYEGFISPHVMRRYAEYMHRHRTQKDGRVRDADDWQKGIPVRVYVSSLVRHTMDFWTIHRGGTVIDPDTGEKATQEDLACAIMFNIMGWLHEVLKSNNQQKG